MNENLEQIESVQSNSSEVVQDVSSGDIPANTDNSLNQDVSGGDVYPQYGYDYYPPNYLDSSEIETVSLWDSNIAEYGVTDGLLLLCLVVLILQLFFRRW